MSLSKVEKYFDNKLNKEKQAENFEEDSEYGFIKIGNFLSSDKRNAIVISFDSITSLKIYELKNNEWEKIYQQNNVNFARINTIEAFIEDYNFDGIKDIGVKNQVSNGTTIMTFHLWLSEGNRFKHIPEFESIGNPTIVEKAKIIKGFEACCAFSEITLCDYHWEKEKLIKIRELDISNYPSGAGVEVTLKNLKEKTEIKHKPTKDEISEIIYKYSENLKLNDTNANIGFAQ
ncbi:MAG TPA: hypothetical protein PLP39_08645 [Flavobacterium lutivivi]|nr:hypothetical protein [Flavobacterium lutivivi]